MEFLGHWQRDQGGKDCRLEVNDVRLTAPPGLGLVLVQHESISKVTKRCIHTLI